MTRRRVLLLSIEDDRRNLLQRLLESAGHTVLTESGQAGLRRALNGDTIDVAIVEVEPGREGAYALVSELRERGDAIATVVLAGRNRDIDRLRGWDQGCDAWIPRPCFVAEILAAIDESAERPASKRAEHRRAQLDAERRRVAAERRE